MQPIESLIKYGDKEQYGQATKFNKDSMRKKKGGNLDEEVDPASLKSYLDTILPPKESTENGQIYMQFVSCQSATKSDVLKLAKELENQMKHRQARETGICNIREELYSECLDELIRQITISCLQRGELLNHIKEQMKETIIYYQKLYESAMAFSMRKVLREQKKRKKLEAKENHLLVEIENLKKQNEEKEREIERKTKEDEDNLRDSQIDFEDSIKQLKFDIDSKNTRLKELLTTPKQPTAVKHK